MLAAIDVYTSLPNCQNMKVATCRFNLRRGQVSCAFSYADAYLAHPLAYAIDPSLPLGSSTQHCDGLPGALRDSAPDRWGRHLIARQVLNNSSFRDAAAGARHLDEVDYLLGVCDTARQGALRYAAPGEDDFLSRQGDVPPVVELKRLLRAAHEIASGNSGMDQVKELLDAGSGSLGGARPKASVVDEGKIYMAKFSHPGDEWDVIAWEKVALELAAAAGIEVPGTKLVNVGDQRVLLLERFDRQGSAAQGPRVPYLSGVSLVGGRDGQSFDYADVVEALVDWSAWPNQQAEELFRRVVLSVALNNTDDHLRNLGLLRLEGAWQLSPLFDVNINPDLTRARATSVYGETGEGAVTALRDFAGVCGLSYEDARRVAGEVVHATCDCASVAKANGCKNAEVELLNSAVQARTQAIAAEFDI